MEFNIKNGVYYYKGLPDDLDKLTKYEAIKDIINPPLSDDQSIDLLKALCFKRFAACYATGLGKTYLASAYVTALKNKDRKSKILLFVKKSQEEETPKKISSISGLKCKFFDASHSKFVTNDDIDNSDIIMMTHDTLNSAEHMKKLLVVINRFTGIIIDEAHLLSNIEGAGSAFMLYCLSHEVEYVLSLTATPVTTDIEQLARVLKVIAPDDVANFKKIGSEMKRFGLGALPHELLDLFIFRDRPFNNHRGLYYFIEPMEHQIGADGKDLFLVTKGDGATKQANFLVKLIKERQPLRGLIYCNWKVNQKYLKEFLLKSGIRCEVINGDTLAKDRTRIITNFKNSMYDVLITNLKEALDMDCDFVTFWEFTPHIKQVIGRAERGLNPKPLDVIWIFTLLTGEYDYFIRNVYNISQEVQEILGIDFAEVISAKMIKYKGGKI